MAGRAVGADKDRLLATAREFDARGDHAQGHVTGTRDGGTHKRGP